MSTVATLIPPSQTRRANPILVWFKRIGLGLLVTLITLSASGLTYQAIATESDRRTFLPPGQLVDVGGFRLHIYCTGPTDTGNPTVILETLSGGASPYWAWVQPEIAKVTRVCSYDRAGRAWSEADPRPISLERTVSNLHTLLANADVPAPYVLVGHSIGGLYMRQYIAEYPQEVAGLALVDSSHPDQFTRYPELFAGDEAILQQMALLPGLARFGVGHLYFGLGGEFDFQDLPARQHAEVAALWSSPDYFNSLLAEIQAGPAIFADAHNLPSLGSLPLAVMSQGKGAENAWAVLQADLANLSVNSLHITVPEATHESLAFNPEHAQLTSAAILQVVAAARLGQPLMP